MGKRFMFFGTIEDCEEMLGRHWKGRVFSGCGEPSPVLRSDRASFGQCIQVVLVPEGCIDGVVFRQAGSHWHVDFSSSPFILITLQGRLSDPFHAIRLYTPSSICTPDWEKAPVPSEVLQSFRDLKNAVLRESTGKVDGRPCLARAWALTRR